MSQQDRDKWNARYEAGAYAERAHPSALLVEWATHVRRAAGARRPWALDLACGAGRNAVWLAEQGFRVDAADVAAAGLARGRALAAERGVSVRWFEQDLDDGLPWACEVDPAEGYDLIIVMRFFDRILLPRLSDRLRPGGFLICEVHLQTDDAVIGPRDAAFRAAPGELATLLAGLRMDLQFEGRCEDPDGRPVALARCVARRSG